MPTKRQKAEAFIEILTEQTEKIFKLAKERGLKNVSIVIMDADNDLDGEDGEVRTDMDYQLMVGDLRKFIGHGTLGSLEESICDHDDLAWMNE